MTEMKLKFQVELAPDEARSKILKAFEGAFASEEASTNRAGFAAKSLGIDVSVLYRFINKLGLKSSIASLRADAMGRGMVHHPNKVGQKQTCSACGNKGHNSRSASCPSRAKRTSRTRKTA